MHYSTDVNSDDSEEIESEIESEIEIDVDDNYDSEYLSDENASKGNGGNRTSKSLRENEAYNGSKDRDEDYDDIEIFSEPVRQLQDNSRERRSLRRNARKGLSL